MELKSYQQGVINDLNLFLEQLQRTNGRVRDSFYDFWLDKGYKPFPGTIVEPYKNNVQSPGGYPVPHVCIKVPTAGGKTFIACNALRPIFDKIEPGRKGEVAQLANVVVWLVPSNAILQQTIQNLRNLDHPYRQKINSHFQHRVEVFDKQALLSGAGFNATAVQGQLSIIVMSFDSLRAKNKEDRKLFQENGSNLSFAHAEATNGHVLEGIDETAVINVIRSLQPVVVVDESHNAESDLSVEMLRNLNPAFILDLTATPRKNSNIISFVDALELKKENMVKLPVIVYNQKRERTEVINSALSLQRRLELLATEERKQGGRYIRPIVLFQAQPKTAEDNHTFEKIKETLIKAGIPSEQIKIKTASTDELKGINLMASDCQVRYIITVNALKEGWDCPFAYILASLADRSSAVDVEQILGRVLRQPHVMKHKSPLLNLSFVLTASSKFRETLQHIVNGLNKAGFSARDYRVIDENTEPEKAKPTGDPLELLLTFPGTTPAGTGTTVPTESPTPTADDLDPANIQYVQGSEGDTPTTADVVIDDIVKKAQDEADEFEKRVKQMEGETSPLPVALADLVDKYKIKDQFQALAATIKLPQFYQRVATGLFGDEEVLLKKEALLADFNLRKADRNIDFGSVDSELYKVDLEEGNKNEYTPRFSHIDGSIKDALLANILPNQTRDGQIKSMTSQMMRRLGNFKPISDKDVEWYVRQVLEDLTEEQFQDLIAQEYSYTQRIKAKIDALTTTYAEKTFGLWLDRDKLFLRPSFPFPSTISPTETGKDLIKSLYVREGKINSFEEKVIDAIANLESVAFWTRNLERGRGFSINGFINHYPDFIIVTKRGKIIVVETKGDHLDNTDTAEKIRLGNLWRSKAGNDYRYFMVFETKEVAGANTLADVANTIREL
ncbi:DEAD/DEAH box helicase family protein [Spirosoma sp.]|uniref:DEAD/DEAH box helicase n=1 Tax=Spirosoma sp. TaxID=1899569 RepID=UPI00263951B9|nr:DEAD/DEAH box helicase family protein [Spirosoma sp.]MCX6212840.1 DEAD/DEAH box helicase family protein [Spirosoma sp.]